MRQAIMRLMAGAVVGTMVWCGTVRADEAWQKEFRNSRATVAPFKTAPMVDGKLAPGEWDGAVGTANLVMHGALTFDPRPGRTWVGFTEERLYIAMVSEITPTGPIVLKDAQNDSELIFSDCVEIWLDPNVANVRKGEGDRAYYKFMGETQGLIYDMKWVPGGTPDTGWNGHWDYKSAVDMKAGTWTIELSIPWADLNVAKEQLVAREIGLLIARNYKAPWSQASWMPSFGGSFVDRAVYPQLTLTKDAPSVQITQLGEKFFNGEVDLKAVIANPGPARKAEVKLNIFSSDMPELNDLKTLDLPAGGTATYTFKVGGERLHAQAKHTLGLLIRDPAANQTLLDMRQMTWTQKPEKIWQVRTGADPDAAAAIGYYPYHNLLKVRATPAELGKEHEKTRAVAIKVTDAAGKVLLEKPLAWDEKQETGEATFELPDLPNGVYTVAFNIPGVKEPLLRTFTRTHRVWERNTLGITAEVYPPFEPIRTLGDTVEVVLRRYAMDGLGLWKSVQARGQKDGSVMQELLAAPIALVADGGRTLQGQGRVTRAAGHEVVFEGMASDPAVEVKTRTVTEYDGCQKVELTLLPPKQKGAELKSLWLDIPLKDELAPIYHVATCNLRINPAGATPAGTGQVWDTRNFPDGDWWGGFRPYIYLGGAERGISWFADNDKGWELDVHPENRDNPYAPGLILIRDKGVLTLRVNLVQKPVAITEPRTIVFGLMATPAKPMPANWRNFRRVFNMGHSTLGLPHAFASQYPINNDHLEPTLQMFQQYRLGNVDGAMSEALSKWWEENKPWKNLPPEAQKGMRWNPVQTTRFGGAGPVTLYFDEYHTAYGNVQDVRDFHTEWSGGYLPPKGFQPLTAEFYYTQGWLDGGANVSGIVQSRRDYMCWVGAKWLRYGAGLYFDNSFLKYARDPITTSAYVLPNGRIQPSSGLWAHRDYQKRIWVLHRQLHNPRTPGFMEVHLTNANIVPTMVWCDSALDLEWKDSAVPMQEKYSPELLQAETTGLQCGNIPNAIATIGYPQNITANDRAVVDNTKWAGLAVHEVTDWSAYKHPLMVDFGYGLPECEVFNYWDDKPAVSVSDPLCKWLLLRRGSKNMLLLCTWNPKPAKVSVTSPQFDRQFTTAKSLPLKSEPEAKTESAHPSLPLTWPHGGSGMQFTVDLEGYGVRLFELQ